MTDGLMPRIVASAFARMGPALREQIARLIERDYEAITYRRLAGLGYKPSAIVDVGAYHGNWTLSARQIFGPVPTLMVEAQPAQIANLERIARDNDSLAVAHAVLGAHDGESVQFFEMGTGSSFFPETSDAPRRASQMVTKRLDDVVADWRGDLENAFLKIDVQGAELEVLAGGMQVLAGCSLVQPELAMLAYNEGAPLLPQVVEWMAEHGWLPTEVSGFSRPRDRLVQIDMLFALRDSALRPTRFHF
jgi:FkbM family methyltransferase